MYNVWNNVLAEIEQKITPANFSTWFRDTSIVSIEDGLVIIGVKNSFYTKQLRNRYLDIITESLKNNDVAVTEIDFEVQSNSKPKVRPREITTNDTLIKNHTKAREYAKKAKNPSGLNTKYTLNNFVVGSNNDLAASAAKSIIDHPGDRYNPFFLYGGPGLGKTHLVQAIGNELLQRNPHFKILYTPISDFYSDFIDSVRKGNGKEFSHKFQELDCLIIDDFQFIVGK